MRKYLRQMISVMVAIALVMTMVPAQTQAASKPKLNATKKSILVGSKITLKVQNAGAGSSYTWKSSNKEVATVTKKGVVTGKSGGSSVITCNVKTPVKAYQLKATITVKDAVTVKTQKALKEALANDGITKIKIKTDNNKKFTIGKGDYTNKLLIVEAPNADIVNNGGVFKRIAIRSIKPATWIERAKGNKFSVSAPESRIVVGKDASVKTISYTKAGAEAKVDIRGNVEKVSVEAAVQVTIAGTASQVKVEASASAKDAKITASVPVQVTAEADIKLELGKGAEGSTVTTVAGVNAEIKNKTSQSVTVTTPDGSGTVEAGSEGASDTVVPPAADSGNSGGNSGTGSGSGNGGSGDGSSEGQKSSENDIKAFTVNSINGVISGSSITVTVASGTAVTALKPVITISDKATVLPASGAEQDFTNPVTYTVTAENGDKKEYIVTVVVEKTEESTEPTEPSEPEESYMNVSAEKLKTAPDDNNQSDSQANQDAITVTTDGTKAGKLLITVSGDLSKLKSFASTNESQGTAKWIGLIVNTGETDITKVKIGGEALTEEDVKDADSVGAEKGKFVLWLKAEKLVMSPRILVLSTEGKKDVTVTISFDDTASSGVYVEDTETRTYYGTFEDAVNAVNESTDETAKTITILNNVGTGGIGEEGYANYDIEKAVTITSKNDAVVYGTLTLLTDGITLDGLTIANRGGNSDKQKNAINVVASTATIKNCHIKMARDNVTGVANGLCIYPMSQKVKYVIESNIFEGYSITAEGEGIKWTSSAVMITEGYNMKDRFGMDEKSATNVTIAENNDETAMAESNTYIRCAIEWLHNDYSGGNEYIYDYCVNGMATGKFAATKKGNAKMVLVATEDQKSTMDASREYGQNVTIELRSGEFAFNVGSTEDETKKIIVAGSFILGESATLEVAEGHTIEITGTADIKGKITGAGEVTVAGKDYYPAASTQE